MSIANITAKCWILALFIRDDGERFLLGDGAYDFKESQQHFSANEFVNDTVDVQGNDGILLAGQVRRASSQVFDGYIGDGTTPKSLVENYRRDFIDFFAKNHFYKVVYVLPDGSAVQRQRGFIVDAPEVKELWQQTPEYHVALNFEDTNYYVYDENAEGEEIYGELANIILSGANGGGAVWEEAVFGGVEFMGATEQTAYSGKNLFDGQIEQGGFNGNGVNISATNRVRSKNFTAVEPKTQYTIKVNDFSTSIGTMCSVAVSYYSSADFTAYRIGYENWADVGDANGFAFTTPEGCNFVRFLLAIGATAGAANALTPSDVSDIQLEAGSTATAFEPYVGGIPAPNPNYPQPINVVTGLQTVTIGGQSLELNLGKNLLHGTWRTVYSSQGYPSPIASDVTITSSDNNNVAVATTTVNRGAESGFIWLPKNTPFTVSFNGTLPDRFFITQYDNARTRVGTLNTSVSTVGTTSATTTQDGYIAIAFTNTVATSFSVTDIQLELGSTATSYASYFDPIELCKIGDYQDYIYKNGANWYLHKETDKLIEGGTTAGIYVSGSSVKVINIPNTTALQGEANRLHSTHFRYKWAVEYGATYISSSYQAIVCAVEGITDTASAVSWLRQNTPSFYYALATPTDTQISDAALISQLNAIEAAGRPTNVSAVSPNLPVVISVDVSGGLVWDEVGVVWEAGSGSGTNSIVVDGIASVSPIWTVSGPITNPTIEILSTNTSLTYEGSLAEGQTLIVDSNKMTATLNGMNVLGSISGDWLELSPGTNRVVFTATQAETTSSTLSWQKVVG